MAANRVEEVRMACGGRVFAGQWDVPAKTVPPHPWVALFGSTNWADRHGTSMGHPGVLPLLELAQALNREGVAAFRYDPLPGVPWSESAARASSDSARHDLMSRRRRGLALFGDAGSRAAGIMDSLRPQAILLVAPPLDVEPITFGDLPMLALLAGAGPNPRGSPAGAAFEAALRRAPRAVIRWVPDLTESCRAQKDWFAGRPIPHLLSLALGAAWLRGQLRPGWEKEPRPPGAAIGATTDGD
jgi:hypothetical protein